MGLVVGKMGEQRNMTISDQSDWNRELFPEQYFFSSVPEFGNENFGFIFFSKKSH